MHLSTLRERQRKPLSSSYCGDLDSKALQRAPSPQRLKETLYQTQEQVGQCDALAYSTCSKLKRRLFLERRALLDKSK